MTMYMRKKKSRSFPLLHLFFSVVPAAMPDRFGLNCEGFARAKGLKDLYLMKNMVMHVYVAWRYPFDMILLLCTNDPRLRISQKIHIKYIDLLKFLFEWYIYIYLQVNKEVSLINIY